MFTRHGLKLNLAKDEVLHIGHHRAGGEETDLTGQFCVLGGAVCGDGKTGRELLRRDFEECRPERTHGEELRGDGGPADLNKE